MADPAMRVEGELRQFDQLDDESKYLVRGIATSIGKSLQAIVGQAAVIGDTVVGEAPKEEAPAWTLSYQPFSEGAPSEER